MYRLISWIARSSLSPIIILTIITTGIYYKLFVLGKIPFPGDLLVGSYMPWLEYYKIPVQNPLISDVFSQFFLWKYLAVETLKNWQWPLWNPYSFTGTPLLATYHSATLYPLNILLLLPKYLGWGLFIYSQTLIASITFYLLASSIVRSKLAALTGAIIFSLGGLMTTWLELGTAVHAIAWLPLALYSIRKFLIIEKFRFIFILIFSLSTLVLAGNAQITTYSFFIISLYSLFLCWKNKIAFSKASILFFALIGSVGLAALQLLPSFDLLQHSIRQSDSYTSEVNFGLLNIKDGLKFFIPDYFGNAVTRNYWGTLNYSETSGFLGILTLPLLIYAFFKVRSEEMFFYSALFISSLLFSFDNPVSHSFYNMKIPLLTSSYASRMLFITLFSASIISSLAINHILKLRNFLFLQKAMLWSWSSITGIIGGTLIAYIYIKKIISQAPDENYLKIYSGSYDYALPNFLIAAKNSLIPFAILSSLLVISFTISLFLRGKIRPAFLGRYKLIILLSFFFILLILDLSRYFLKFNPFVSNNLIFPKNPSIDFLQKQDGLFRVGREHAEVLPPNTWTFYNLYSIEGYDPVYPGEYAKFMHFINGGDIRLSTTGRYAEIASNYQSAYLDTANVKYYIAILRDHDGKIPGDLLNYKFKETTYKTVYKDKSSAILENPYAKERVYFAQYIKNASIENAQKIFMEDKSFDPGKITILSEDMQISSVTGKGTAAITSYSPNTVEIETSTTSDEVLILADQYEDGWKAKIDGQDTKISRANIIFRAVKIPAGSHKVVFSYWPASFDIGLKISSASLLLITLISLLQIRARRW